MKQNVFGVTGWKNSGKTTLTERLVAAFAERGLKVATVKHAHHAFDVDQPGTDSFRHRAAGAREVAIVSSLRWALMHELKDEAEPTLADILSRLSPSDLVLVEGFKRHSHPKIECRRGEARDQAPLAGNVPAIVAVASDAPTADGGLPSFDLDDIEGIADFIVAHLNLQKRKNR
ncbi:molybdopterin-guanine dinucleotide biosynthesis protein B [Chelativorans sp. M5D2P16]|uniref:molybdopterin-guanine dinucleotide biosynthesis protein B n=1 Tax=Chelativorans sp. M5D2P16 TaxID=3095678 RepID=UPI002ACA8E42|nr:molybdopterin-guanine dinucleotide biosynthesis protein B [Chelativorans sp. M5D2P16]MDZ5697777.1 molybdopterin-guanine dinucleotide biosynthesis protein B [Chelativorans sp. M5D2P16]